MVFKEFDLTIPFTEDQETGLSYPIVTARFLATTGRWETLPLLFDTGASDICLRPKYGQFFGPAAAENVNAVGDANPRQALVAKSKIELFGLVQDCEVVLVDIPGSPLFAGLLGRSCLSPFEFGYSQSSRQLHVQVMGQFIVHS